MLVVKCKGFTTKKWGQGGVLVLWLMLKNSHRMLHLSICPGGSRDCALVPELNYFRYSITARQNADTQFTSVCVFQHLTVFALEHYFALTVTEDEPNDSVWHQSFYITDDGANSCRNRTGFVIPVLPVNDNRMLGKWDPLLPGLSSWVKASLTCVEFSPVFWRMP